MRKFVVALAIISLSASLSAQTDNDRNRNVVVAALSVTSDSRISSSNLEDIRAQIQNQRYSEDALSEIGASVRYALQTRGYFKSRVGEPEVKVLERSALGSTIAVTLPIDQGEQYRLREISFSNNKVFSSAQLRSHFDIGAGDIFNTKKIRLGLEELRKLYGSDGYINFTPVPNTQTDEAARLVSLNVDVDEGAQFRFGPLELAGEEPRPGVGQKLVVAWQPYVGKVCDPTLAESFWKEHLIPFLPSGSHVQDVVEQSVHPQEHIVAYKVTFP